MDRGSSFALVSLLFLWCYLENRDMFVFRTCHRIRIAKRNEFCSSIFFFILDSLSIPSQRFTIIETRVAYHQFQWWVSFSFFTIEFRIEFSHFLLHNVYDTRNKKKFAFHQIVTELFILSVYLVLLEFTTMSFIYSCVGFALI